MKETIDNYPPGSRTDLWYPFSDLPRKIPWLSQKGDSMTIIAAIMFDDHILMASDSKETQEGFVNSTPKLKPFPIGSVIFAGCGPVHIVNDFTEWVLKTEWHKDLDWEALRSASLKELNRLNKANRKSIRASGIKPTKDDVSSILFGGYLQEQPNILEVTDGGESFLHSDRGFGVIGSGRAHFNIAKFAIEQFAKIYLKQSLYEKRDDIFWFYVYLASQTDPKSGFPLQKRYISANEVKDFDQEQKRRD